MLWAPYIVHFSQGLAENNFGGSINATNYMTEGLSLEKPLIAGLDRDESVQLLDGGFE